jgi:hypothetical protein
MYVVHMSIKVTSLGRYLLNINNNQALEVHEIIFWSKKYLITYCMIQIDKIGIIIKYLNCLTYFSGYNYA